MLTNQHDNIGYEQLAELKNSFLDFILNNGPYSHFVTLTYPDNIRSKEARIILRKFLSKLERKLFGKNNKHGQLNGFIFTEKQINNQVHHHILIKDSSKFTEVGKPPLEEHFSSLLNKFHHTTANNIAVSLNANHCDIRPIHEITGLVDYLLKSHRTTRDFDFIEPIQTKSKDR